MKSPGFLPLSQALCWPGQPGPSPRNRPRKRTGHGHGPWTGPAGPLLVLAQILMCQAAGGKESSTGVMNKKGICLSNFRLFLSLIGTRSCQAAFKSQLCRRLLNCGRSKPIIVLPPGTFLLQRDLTVDILWTLSLPIKAANSSFSEFFKEQGDSNQETDRFINSLEKQSLYVSGSLKPNSFQWLFSLCTLNLSSHYTGNGKSLVFPGCTFPLFFNLQIPHGFMPLSTCWLSFSCR